MQEDDPKSAAKKARYHPQTERLMRQFLRMESSVDKKAYNRGYTYNFEFTQEQRDKVSALMASGMSFEEAFDYYVTLPESQRGG